jgi:glucosylglycerate synthase
VTDAAAAIDLFADTSLDTLATAGPVDVLAGVHVSNQATRIVNLLDTIASALEAYRPARRAGVLVADAGSQDDTPTVVRAWCDASGAGASRGCLDVIAPRHRRRAIVTLLLAAQRLGARALVLLDADLTSVRADWIGALLDPLLRDEADYVSPAYSRSVSEGTLTTNLLAPFTGALYGRRIQQVMGGCAAVAGNAIGSWLVPSVEKSDGQAHGAEIWLTTAALASGARIVEVQLDRKVMTAGGPQPDLPTILVRSAGPLFDLMELYDTAWLASGKRVPVGRRGNPEVHADARSPDVERMVRAFDLGLKDLLPVWEQIVPESTLAELYPLALLPAEEFRLSPRLWARIVGDFAVAYHDRRLPRDHLLRALTPLYLGRVAAFIVQARQTPLERMSGIFDTIDRAFEDEREHLVARWR